MERANATVSIIVPVYNIQDYLPACIESIISQTYKNFEAILVDDGSIDRCGEICEEYAEKDARIKVIHKKNGGLTSARNAGLAKASGKWIMHVDGDDWIEPDMLELLVTYAEQTGADLVFGDFVKYGPYSGSYFLPSWTDNKVDSLNSYIGYMWTCLWGSIAKISLYRENGLKSPAGINYCEDFHLIVRLCFYAKRIGNVHKPLYNYRYRPTSIIGTLNKRTELDEQWVYQDIIRFFKEQNVYPDYKKVMKWRVLKSAQELLLDPTGLDRFQELYQDGENDMWSCPFVNTKIKILAWLMTHHLRPAVVAIDKFRMILGR